MGKNDFTDKCDNSEVWNELVWTNLMKFNVLHMHVQA